MAANSPDPLAGMSDAELGAYCDAHLGDEAMAAALAPIDRWANELPTPDWQRIAELANASLHCSAWGPLPFTADQ